MLHYLSICVEYEDCQNSFPYTDFSCKAEKDVVKWWKENLWGLKLIECGHLLIDRDCGKAYLLGYDMKLTPNEYTILVSIVKEGSLSEGELSELLGKSGKGNRVSVHICSINRKAKNIGGRYLVIHDDDGYSINELM